MLDASVIAIGDELPAFTRDGTVEHWMRFAAANYEFSPHHWDGDVAREEGFPGAFAMAPLQHAFLHAMLRNWIGEVGRIVTVNIKLRSPFVCGRTLSAGGKVAAVRQEDEEVFIDLDIWQDDDEGTRLALGAATISLGL